jgi:hypothetical protein
MTLPLIIIYNNSRHKMHNEYIVQYIDMHPHIITQHIVFNK